MKSYSQLSGCQLNDIFSVLERLKEKGGSLEGSDIWIESGIDLKSSNQENVQFHDLSRQLQKLKEYRQIIRCLQGSLERSIHGLQKSCTAISLRIGLHSLPDEVIARIIEITSPSQILSRVCKRFRTISLSTPSVWTYFHTHSFIKQREELWLRRSGNMPLHVVVGGKVLGDSVDDDTPREGFLPTILPQIQRFKKLIVNGKSLEIQEHLKSLLKKGQSRVHLPVLESLSVSDDTKIVDLVDAPLSHVLVVYPNCIRAQLSELIISLARLPTLTHLTLFFFNVYQWAFYSKDDPALSSVRTLELVLNECAESLVQEFCHRVKFPNLKTLKVEIEKLSSMDNFRMLNDSMWTRESLSRNITALELNIPAIKAYVAEVLAKTLRFCPALSYLNVHISGNRFFAYDADEVFDDSNLWSIRSPLEVLILDKCDQLSDEELRFIGMQLRRSRYWSVLQRLDVICCRALTQEFLFWFQNEMEGRLTYVIENGRYPLLEGGSYASDEESDDSDFDDDYRSEIGEDDERT